ncbi:DUF5675 family protein [Arcicella sp. LKC2W]|uniref:DUF5675 family protein n=1 Tax=Arcicella sp. LKC2W TaxID=2984198 RepID=UPI002B21D325|nr:DUF5675 family protein [Arcicella sp. LKC2W]MEA5458700.1 DUF5675 family protein [Arcicella sp. LKC2W]
MELTLIRTKKTELSTMSQLFVDDKHQCFTIEDTDRGLTQDMPLQEIKKRKVFGKTAIPEGRYQVKITFSTRFKRLLPEILNVPAYEGIRMHVGNYPKDTEGCILPGELPAQDCVLKSKPAFDKLFDKLTKVPQDEKIWITITSLA